MTTRAMRVQPSESCTCVPSYAQATPVKDLCPQHAQVTLVQIRRFARNRGPEEAAAERSDLPFPYRFASLRAKAPALAPGRGSSNGWIDLNRRMAAFERQTPAITAARNPRWLAGQALPGLVTRG